MSKFSKRSIEALKGVLPLFVAILTEAVKDAPDDFTIIEGVRTEAMQVKYYSWGRTEVNPNTGPLKGLPFGRKVTNRDGVKSKSEHQPKADGYGRAVDFVPFKVVDGKSTLDWNDVDAFRRIARRVQDMANKKGVKIKWGGDWKNPYDPPHLEIIS